MIFNAKRRYWQALSKARVIRDRRVRAFLNDKIEVLDGETEEPCLIAAIARAYKDGLRDATKKD